MAKRRRWTDEDKATALAACEANDGNVLLTAKQLDIPKSTLYEWVNSRGVPETIPELRKEKKNQLADELETVAYQLTAALVGKIDDASLQQTATSLGIVIDKMNRLRGEPTEISDRPIDLERIAGVMALFDLARARRDRGDDPLSTRPFVDSTARPTDRGVS
jgi:hypothetical protein